MDSSHENAASTPPSPGQFAAAVRSALDVALVDHPRLAGRKLEIGIVLDHGAVASFDLSIDGAGYRLTVTPISEAAERCECGEPAVGVLRRLYARAEEPVCIACAGRLGLDLRNVESRPEAAQ